MLLIASCFVGAAIIIIGSITAITVNLMYTTNIKFFNY